MSGSLYVKTGKAPFLRLPPDCDLISFPHHALFVATMASFARNLIASGFATLLILSSNLYLYSAPNPQQEIISEVFCWTLILIIGIVYFHVLPNTRPATTSFLGLNYFALCVALLCLSESFEIVNWFSVSIGALETPH